MTCAGMDVFPEARVFFPNGSPLRAGDKPIRQRQPGFEHGGKKDRLTWIDMRAGEEPNVQGGGWRKFGVGELALWRRCHGDQRLCHWPLFLSIFCSASGVLM